MKFSAFVSIPEKALQEEPSIRHAWDQAVKWWKPAAEFSGLIERHDSLRISGTDHCHDATKSYPARIVLFEFENSANAEMKAAAFQNDIVLKVGVEKAYYCHLRTL